MRNHTTGTLTLFLLATAILLIVTPRAHSQQEASGVGIWSLAWSPDGSKLASANSNGQVTIRNRRGDLLLTLSGHQDRTLAISWSSDGQFLASGGWDDVIRIWDAASGSLVQEIEAFRDGVATIAWQPNGNQLIANGFDTFRAWNTSNWQPITEPISVTLLNLEWNSSGSKFAYASAIGVGIASIDQGQIISDGFDSFFSDGFIYAVNWSSDNSSIISSGQDGTVRLWNATTGQQLATLLQTSQTITDAVFIEDDGSRVAAVTEGGDLFIINVASGEVEQTRSANASLQALAWSSEEDLLAIGGITQDAQTDADADLLSVESGSGFLNVMPVSDLVGVEATQALAPTSP